MTTKTEMTLENVCFRYDGSKEAKECFGAFRDATKCLWSPQDGMIYGIVDNKPKIDFVVPIGFTEVSPSDYLLILSAPESQAHLLTEKESNDMAHVSEHKSAMEYLKEPSLKELSQPPVMEGKDIDAACVNSLQELDDALKLISPFGTMYISNPKIRQAIHDFHYQKTAPLQDEIKSLRYDLFHVTANEQSLQSEVEQLKGLLKEAQPFCGTMLRGKIEHYTSK